MEFDLAFHGHVGPCRMSSVFRHTFGCIYVYVYIFMGYAANLCDAGCSCMCLFCFGFCVGFVSLFCSDLGLNVLNLLSSITLTINSDLSH